MKFRHIDNLTNEESVEVNRLKRTSELIGIYIHRANKITQTNQGQLSVTRVIQIKNILSYYSLYLIPALQETMTLRKKHIKIIENNPDNSFKPIKIELKNHKKLMKKFFNRFNEIRQEFDALSSNYPKD